MLQCCTLGVDCTLQQGTSPVFRHFLLLFSFCTISCPVSVAMLQGCTLAVSCNL